ncbi:hypothetical protein L208DRAFT_1284137 [Tricholoma matsutake]|nr:hypothetical protein L208DRAFT_1284137 [Tricholoma matsutake 945]
MGTTNSYQDNNALLQSAKLGFDHLFSNDIVEAKKNFERSDDPFHLLGLGVCSFLEAALGMETGLLAEAARCLTLSEAGARKKHKSDQGSTSRAGSGSSRFPPGLEWEILVADAVVMLGLTHALSESYMGYLQCINLIFSSTRLYKTVFPHGLDPHNTPARTLPSLNHTPSFQNAPSRTGPVLSTSTSMSNLSIDSTTRAPPTLVANPDTNTNSSLKSRSSFFGRWTSGSTLTIPVSFGRSSSDVEDGPVDELIIAGTAFGYGLFNLVFSLLPKKVQSVVGLFGFKHDRKIALQSLAVSAAKKDVHSVFAGLVLMSYYGTVLLILGYQADEAQIFKQYKALVDSIAIRYPQGALWILNRARILRMSHDAEGAIKLLQEGLRPERPTTFVQADTILIFELAWTLLGQRRYQESADMFMRITELNSWSHGTYYFLAAGCYISLGNLNKAQELLNTIPDLISKKKLSGKDLPTEVLIKKKLEFYKEKQKWRCGDEKMYVQAIKISTAEELGIFWSLYARIDKTIAQAHIEKWLALTPTPSKAPTPILTAPDPHSHQPDDLDNPDDLALRSLLLGISYRTTGEYASSRTYLKDAYARQSAIRVSTWIPGVAMFEMAVLDLKVVEARESSKACVDGNVERVEWDGSGREEWERALTDASEKLDVALSLATSTVDLSSRLDSRITMLRDEIVGKREMLGLPMI